MQVRWLAALGLVLALAGTARAKDRTVVRFGTDATYPPFESVDPSGKIVGWEVDYGDALRAKMSVTCTWQNLDWDGLIPALLGGKFDVILSSTDETPARAKHVLFSDVYYATAPVWVAAAANKSNDVTPAALKGKTVGTQSATVLVNYLEKHYQDSVMKTYHGGDEPFTDLANGRLEYVLSDILVAQKFISKNSGCCRIVTEIDRNTDPTVFGPGVGAAFRPEDTDLRDRMNKAIAELRADGTFKRLADRYFTVDIAPKGDMPVSISSEK